MTIIKRSALSLKRNNCKSVSARKMEWVGILTSITGQGIDRQSLQIGTSRQDLNRKRCWHDRGEEERLEFWTDDRHSISMRSAGVNDPDEYPSNRKFVKALD